MLKKRCGWSLQSEQCRDCEFHVCERKGVAEVYRVSSAETEFHVCGRKGVGGVYRVSSAETVSFMCVEEKVWVKSTG